MDTKVHAWQKDVDKKDASNTLKEDYFSCHCLNPFTFEVVHDMRHLSPEQVYASDSSLVFHGVSPKIKQFTHSHWPELRLN